MKCDQGCYENEFARFWVQNGILFFEYKPNIVINLEAAKIIVADRILMQNEKSYPILCDIRGILYIDKAARDYFAQSCSVLIKAVSLVGQQSVSLVLTSFYLRINKPSIPTKIFKDKSAALAFLQDYI